MHKFDPFYYENLFYTYELNITEAEINQVLLLVKDDDTKEMKTTYNRLNVLNFPLLNNLKKQVTNILDKQKLLLTDNWAQLYNINHEHGIHSHTNSYYSGIIYIKGNKTNPTIFYSKTFNKYLHEFKENTMLLFPSYIPHEVKQLTKNEKRLVISFNTKYG